MVGSQLRQWVTPQRLADWVRDTRQRTMELVADLDDEQLVGPKIATINPLIWEIGHLAWFQETFVLRRCLGHAPIVPHADAIWDSGAIPHDTRWHLDLPSRPETLRFMEQVRDRVVEAVLDPGVRDDVLHLVLYTVFHEDTHTEALTYTRQTLGYPPPKLSELGDGSDGAAAPLEGDAGPLKGDAEIDGGTLVLGATGSEPFVYDNEKWGHPVEVAPFAMARAPVTQRELAAFVEDGGYQRRELWGHDGWAWRQAAGAEHPLYWRRDGDGWQRRAFDRWVDLEQHRPAVHLNWYEADAWCRWAGRRLPTEAEWELAAATTPGSVADPRAKRRYPWGDGLPSAEQANTDWRAMGTVDVAAHPAGDSPHGPRQLVGNVWEWTASTFMPYPNFERDAYADNSEPWFGDRKVLRGGAWATRGRYVRSTYRNYFTLERRDVFAGFRTCAASE